MVQIPATPALRALLGCSPRDLQGVDIDRLRTSVVEGDLLDYKGHDRDDKAKSDWAKDVAAFANQSGGVIILGVAEDRSTKKLEFVGCEPTPGLEETVHEVIAARVFPFPRYELCAIPKDQTYPGAVVIHVAPSVAGASPSE